MIVSHAKYVSVMTTIDVHAVRWCVGTCSVGQEGWNEVKCC